MLITFWALSTPNITLYAIFVLSIKGIFRYRHIYPMAIEAISDGRVPIKKIVTNMFEFPHVQEALDACVGDKANIIKGVIRIG